MSHHVKNNEIKYSEATEVLSNSATFIHSALNNNLAIFIRT